MCVICVYCAKVPTGGHYYCCVFYVLFAVPKCIKEDIITAMYPLHDREELKRLSTDWYKAFFKAQPIGILVTSSISYFVELKCPVFSLNSDLNKKFRKKFKKKKFKKIKAFFQEESLIKERVNCNQ